MMIFWYFDYGVSTIMLVHGSLSFILSFVPMSSVATFLHDGILDYAYLDATLRDTLGAWLLYCHDEMLTYVRDGVSYHLAQYQELDGNTLFPWLVQFGNSEQIFLWNDNLLSLNTSIIHADAFREYFHAILDKYTNPERNYIDLISDIKYIIKKTIDHIKLVIDKDQLALTNWEAKTLRFSAEKGLYQLIFSGKHEFEGMIQIIYFSTTGDLLPNQTITDADYTYDVINESWTIGLKKRDDHLVREEAHQTVTHQTSNASLTLDFWLLKKDFDEAWSRHQDAISSAKKMRDQRDDQCRREEELRRYQALLQIDPENDDFSRNQFDLEEEIGSLPRISLEDYEASNALVDQTRNEFLALISQKFKNAKQELLMSITHDFLAENQQKIATHYSAYRDLIGSINQNLGYSAHVQEIRHLVKNIEEIHTIITDDFTNLSKETVDHYDSTLKYLNQYHTYISSLLDYLQPHRDLKWAWGLFHMIMIEQSLVVEYIAMSIAAKEKAIHDITKKQLQYNYVYTKHQIDIKEHLVKKWEHLILSEQNPDTKLALDVSLKSQMASIVWFQKHLDSIKEKIDAINISIHQCEKIITKHDITISMLNHLITYQDYLGSMNLNIASMVKAATLDVPLVSSQQPNGNTDGTM